MDRNATIEEMESYMYSFSQCYNDSSAFRQALSYVEEHDEDLYAELVEQECEEMGAFD